MLLFENLNSTYLKISFLSLFPQNHRFIKHLKFDLLKLTIWVYLKPPMRLNYNITIFFS